MNFLIKKCIAVLGGTGMAGHVIVKYLEEKYNVHFMSLSSKNTEKSKSIDVTDLKTLTEWLDKIKPNVIINCIGLLQKESEARPDLAILINSHLPHFLEYKYLNTDTKIIHLSTDCVFSGKKGGYLEDNLPDGDTIYDRTKALGEINNNKDLTFRMSIIGPDCNKLGTGLFNWFMKQTGIIKGYSKAIWNGITTIELASAINKAIEQDLKGLYHLVPDESIDKYQLLLLFKEIFNKQEIKIELFNDFIIDKTLINTRQDFNFKVNPYKTQIINMKYWIDKNKYLYEHYLYE